jgi:hypothetical protein
LAALGVVLVGGDAIGFGDFGFQEQRWMPLGGGGTSLRGAGCFSATGFQAAVVIVVGSDISLGID